MESPETRPKCRPVVIRSTWAVFLKRAIKYLECNLSILHFRPLLLRQGRERKPQINIQTNKSLPAWLKEKKEVLSFQFRSLGETSDLAASFLTFHHVACRSGLSRPIFTP